MRQLRIGAMKVKNFLEFFFFQMYPRAMIMCSVRSPIPDAFSMSLECPSPDKYEDRARLSSVTRQILILSPSEIKEFFTMIGKEASCDNC